MKNVHLALFVFFFCLFFLVLLHMLQRNFSWIYINNDFFDYYLGAKLFYLGKNIYGPNPDFIRLVHDYDLRFMWATGYSYPPFFAMLFGLFTFIPPFTLGYVWLLLNTCIYGCFAYAVSIREKRKFIIALYILTFMPALYSIAAGQVNIVLLLMLARYIYHQRGGTLFLALAAVIKVYPLLFILKEVLQKNWRFLCVTVIILSVFFFLPCIFDGGKNSFFYVFEFIPSLNNTPHTYYINQSINGVLSRIFTTVEKNDLILIPVNALSMINLSLSVSLLLYACFATWYYKKNGALTLFWLGVISLSAGKNSFWNFTPCVLIGMFLIKNWKSMTIVKKELFVGSVLITNVGWNGVYFLDRIIPVETLVGRSMYVALSSLGFIALAVQLILLHSFFIPRKPLFTHRLFNINRV